MSAGRASLSERIYGALLKLYPSDFRREFGDQIHLQFREECWEEKSRGGWLWFLLLWLRTFPDLLRSLLREWCSDVVPDLRYGFRRLRVHPATTLAALFTIALTIGGNSAIFSFVDSALLRALPFPRADELVRLTTAERALGTERATPAEFHMWRQQSGLFANTAAYVAEFVNLTSREQSLRVNCASVTPEFFKLFAIQPALGRTFGAEESPKSLEPAVVLSHRVWQRQFGSDPGLVGKAVIIDNKPFAVAGILPAGFRFLNEDVDLWRPLNVDEPRRVALILPEIFARLRSGLTPRAAEAGLRVIQRQLADQEPLEEDRDPKVTLVSDEFVRPVRSSILMLMACGIFVLLIAGFNLSSVQQSYNAGRRREFAIRMSLGASRQRLLRQFLAESWLLSGIGGLAGIAVTACSNPVMWALGPENLTRFPQPVVNTRVLLFALLATTVFVTFTGLLPGIFLFRMAPDHAPRSWLPSFLRVSAGSLRREILVVPQIGLALALVLTTGLLVRSYANLCYVDTGFEARGLATVSVLMGPEYRGQFEEQLSRDRQLLDRLGSLPGADEAALTTWLPMTDSAHWWRVSFADRISPSNTEVRAGQSAVSPDYFRVMRTPLLEGRPFSGSDTVDSAPVVIVNDTMARRYYPNESPVGRRIRLGEEGMPWMTIIGVVASIRHLGLDTAPSSETYVPFTQYRYLQLTHFVLRSHTDPRSLLAGIVPAIHSVDKALPALSVGTMQDRLAATLEPRQFQTILVAAFGTLALLLSTIGIYGVLSRSVALRRYEIAVRMAVGASPADVARLILVQGAAIAAGGSVIGIAIAWTSAPYLQSFLYGVTPSDPMTYCGGCLLVLGIAVVACGGPARQASMTDPIRLFRDVM
jgi:putative ABC transport system permease protein